MIHTVTLLLASALLASATEPAKPVEIREIQKKTREARTPSEHLAVASHWEARALVLDAQAAKHERDADALERRDGHNPMKYKWPAMVQAPIDRLRAKAMQARRAAHESRELMAHHREISERMRAGE